MRFIIVISLMIVISPANAHCYGIWHYKYPQQCEHRNFRKPIFSKNGDHNWFVEITKLPTDIERQDALERLKEKLK
jgi:hypothetical protein